MRHTFTRVWTKDDASPRSRHGLVASGWGSFRVHLAGNLAYRSASRTCLAGSWSSISPRRLTQRGLGHLSRRLARQMGRKELVSLTLGTPFLGTKHRVFGILAKEGDSGSVLGLAALTAPTTDSTDTMQDLLSLGLAAPAGKDLPMSRWPRLPRSIGMRVKGLPPMSSRAAHASTRPARAAAPLTRPGRWQWQSGG